MNMLNPIYPITKNLPLTNPTKDFKAVMIESRNEQLAQEQQMKLRSKNIINHGVQGDAEEKQAEADKDFVDELLTILRLEVMPEQIVLRFNEEEEECVPRKIVKIGKKRFTYHLDRKTLAKRKKKYRLWKRYLISKDKKIYEEYCRCRNQYRRLTRKAIKSHEKEIAKNTKCNNKVFLEVYQLKD